jgi:tRNA A-37 threonylcarbamoyl transferase component Bud32
MLESFQGGNLERKESSEEWFYRKAGELPAELAKKWIDEYENEEDPEGSDFYTIFKDFLENRSLVLKGTLEVASGTDEAVLEEINLLKSEIDKTYVGNKGFLGEGRTAKVYIHPIAPHVCIKYIKNVKSYTDTDIPLYEEFYRLRELQNFEINGIRTPVPYFKMINTDSGQNYGMERIMGNTLFKIIEKPKENIDLINLAKTLDREAVKKDLVSYIKAVHDNFKITHGDLDDINIMLGLDGHFYIIDFGKSKHEEVGEDHEMYRDDDVRRIKLAIEGFFNRLDNISIM